MDGIVFESDKDARKERWEKKRQKSNKESCRQEKKPKNWRQSRYLMMRDNGDYDTA